MNCWDRVQSTLPVFNLSGHTDTTLTETGFRGTLANFVARTEQTRNFKKRVKSDF